MKNKHIQIESDNLLFRKIQRSVHSEINDDKKRGIRNLSFKFMIYMLGTCSFYVAILRAETSWGIMAAYLMYGFTALLFAFNFAHDLSHNALFRNKHWNHFFFVVLYTLVGAHAESWKHRHIRSHHFAPNVKDYDTDLQLTSLIRVEPGSERKRFHRYQHIYAPFVYTSYSLYWIFVKDFYVYFQDIASKKLTWNYHLSFWLQKSIYLMYLLIIPLQQHPLSVSVVLISFLVMHLCQSLFLLFTFFITHHVESTRYFETDDNGKIQTSWLDNQLSSSNDFYPFSELANFIFGGFNNHIAHHLFPHLNHIYYPKLNRVLYRVLRENGYEPNRTSYLGGVLSHLKHLRRMGKSDKRGQNDLEQRT